jgi:hypothetical protein
MRTRSFRISAGILKTKCMILGMLSLPRTSSRTQRCSKPAVYLKMEATTPRTKFSGIVGKWRKLTSCFLTWLRSATPNNLTSRTRQQYCKRTPLPNLTCLTPRVFSSSQPRTVWAKPLVSLDVSHRSVSDLRWPNVSRRKRALMSYLKSFSSWWSKPQQRIIPSLIRLINHFRSKSELHWFR